MRGPLNRLLVRLRAHFRRETTSDELDEELRYHLDRETERNVARGLSPDQAREAAHRAMGNEAGLREEMRDALEWRWLAALQRDVGYALRALRRSPGFAATVVLTIAVVLGLNTTVLTVFNAYVLRPLAIRDPGSLYRVLVTAQSGQEQSIEGWIRWEAYEALAQDRSTFDEVIAQRPTWLRIDQRRAMGELVSGNYFRMLGVGAILGRTLEPDDTRAFGSGTVLVLSHRYWKNNYGADSSVVGRTIRIRGMPFTIVGVAGPAFTGMTESIVDFWAPITMTRQFEGNAARLGDGPFPDTGVLGRVARGARLEAVQDRVALLFRALPGEESPERRIVGVTLESRSTKLPISPELLVLLIPIAVAFALVTVISCANVANMMLARGLARQREIGIRLALGAARGQLVRQLMTEALVLALPAAGLGYLLSRVTLDVTVQMMFASLPESFRAAIRIISLAPDHRVFLLTLGLALFSALLFGLVPALHATRLDLTRLTRGESASGRPPARLRHALVVVQVAGCLLLMVTAGLLLRGASRSAALDPGIRTRGVLQAEVSDRARVEAVSALREVPGISVLAAAIWRPALGIFGGASLRLAGSDRIETGYYNRVSAAYFDVLGLEVVEGRAFNTAEERGNLPVVVLSETAARRLATGSVVGMSLRLAMEEDASARVAMREDASARAGLALFRESLVVGVVRDAIPGLIYHGRQTAIAYFPASEHTTGAVLLFTVPGPVDAARRLVEETMERMYPGALDEVYDLDQALATQVFPMRAAAWISGVLGGLALFLTFTGLYGVLAYLVGQRTREIGIRVALGADTVGVVRLVLSETLRIGLIGGAIGLGLSLLVSRIFATNMETLRTFDPFAYGGSVVVALVACLAAASIPSYRAARVDPLTALRD